MNGETQLYVVIHDQARICNGTAVNDRVNEYFCPSHTWCENGKANYGLIVESGKTHT